MYQRKKFVTPRVVQEVPVQLEKDLLQGPSSGLRTTIISAGQAVEMYDFSEDSPNNDYTVEWD